MKRLVFLSILVLTTLLAVAQSSDYESLPKRTPEEMARKQTEMLVRELEIEDSLKTDTIYRIHLKYAIRQKDLDSREEAINHVQCLYAELKKVLTVEQYDQFISLRKQHPRHPQQFCRMPLQVDSSHTK